MQFSIVALFATSALAAICPTGIYSNPLCCITDVFGVIGQNCEAPQGPVSDGISFQNACAAVGLDPLCCVAPVANQGILCQRPVGSS